MSSRTLSVVGQIRAIERYVLESTPEHDIDLKAIWEALDRAKRTIERDMRWQQIFAKEPAA
jgi:DNA-binding FrmR family transcriptional regulator